MVADVVSVDSLSVTFDEKTILDGVSFSVRKGEVFALFGGNGAGKSTTIKTILGLIEPTSGQVSVLGLSVGKDTEAIRRRIAYLPESAMLYGHLTALENISYFLSLSGIDKSQGDMESALTIVALKEDSWHSPLAKYSKGMRQKTAIALALLRDASLLLLDEPTSGLDPRAIEEFNQLVTALAKQGRTIFLVSHDIYASSQIANRIALLEEGRLSKVIDRQGNASIDSRDLYQSFFGDSQ